MKELIRRRPGLVLGLAVVVVLVSLVGLVLVIARGLPPKTVVMTTGPDGSAYRAFGEKYRDALARDGVRLELRPSRGNVENLARLDDASSGVSVGFAAGGLTDTKASPAIESLGTISYDPIWIFCRDVPEEAQFWDLRGRRLSLDPDAGILPELLRASGLEHEVTVVPLAPAAGGEALLRGEIDCACMLTVADDPVVKKLLADERASLMSFRRADAFVALYPYLSKIAIPRGVGSLPKDLPPQDVTLIAPMASLLVRHDLHPAVQYLLLQAAEEIHSGPGALRRPGQFPAAQPDDVPLTKEARDFYKSGGSFFQRHLPFWLSVLATRLVLVLVPLLGLLYPLLRILPLAFRYVVERRVNVLYAELRGIEARIGAEPAREVARDLARLEERILRARVPTRDLYDLRRDAGLVGARLGAATTGSAPGDP